jgi:hypothetical protein
MSNKIGVKSAEAKECAEAIIDALSYVMHHHYTSSQLSVVKKELIHIINDHCSYNAGRKDGLREAGRYCNTWMNGAECCKAILTAADAKEKGK